MKIQIQSDPSISQDEVNTILSEEKALYADRGEELAAISISLDNNDIVVKSFKRTPIKRIRRVTGYLSEEHNFNNAKRHELNDRQRHSLLH